MIELYEDQVHINEVGEYADSLDDTNSEKVL